MQLPDICLGISSICCDHREPKTETQWRKKKKSKQKSKTQTRGAWYQSWSWFQFGASLMEAAKQIPFELWLHDTMPASDLDVRWIV